MAEQNLGPRDFFAKEDAIADLGLIACPGAEELCKLVDSHLVRWAREVGNTDVDTFIIPSDCPRFQSGDAKGLVKASTRGDDLYIFVDPGNYSVTYQLFGYENHLSPDDHFQNLMRLIQAVAGRAHRISVIMPSLYGGRQHRRVSRESLDCAFALQQLRDVGVKNIITFDAHDPRVMNAVPTMSFDNVMPTYQVLKCLLHHVPDVSFHKDNFMIVSPDEGAMNRNMYYSSVLGCNLGMFYKRRDYSRIVNGRNPIVAHEYLGESVEGKDVFIADDIIAILVIAVFYGHAPSFEWLAAAVFVLAVLIVMNRMHVYALPPYLVVGAVLWYCVLMSGVHATIAGVLLAFTIPTGSRVNLHSFMDWSGEKVRQAREAFEPESPVLGQGEYLSTVKSLSRVSRQVVPPAVRLEHRLNPWVNFLMLPLFALCNAGVPFMGSEPAAVFGDPVFYGVALGLLLGKPVGIMLFSFATVKLKAARLPEGVTWMHMLGAAILGGVGFTMAIFVANLAYADAARIAVAKLGILMASAVAGIVGFLFLLAQAKRRSREQEATAPVDGE